MEYLSAVASLMQCFCKQDCLRNSVSKQCSYLGKPQAILLRLDEQMKVLNAQETDIRHMVDIGKALHDMQPKAEVKLWLENVEKITDSVNQIKRDNQDQLCVVKCFPNYCFRLKLGNIIDEKIHDVNKLLEHAGKFSENVLVGKLPERGKMLPTTQLMGETAERNVKEIWDSLMDDGIGTIGIYGMGGVGKTTILIEINNRLVRENAYFENIIWVTASRDCNLQKLQKDIAKAVGLNFDNDDDEMTRAAKLWGALRRQNKFLLIIDDLWQAFSLESVGIPSPEQCNSCKLVITTRSLSVCRGMETGKEVEIKVLSTEEAWLLFTQKVGGDIVSCPNIKAVARNIAKECGGLPLAIVAVGRALRKENDVRQWQIALRELQNSTASLEGLENQVFARLRFSYERLRDDTTRSCFLYCALYPEDHHIETEELIRYWIYEGLLGNLGDIQTKMQQGYIILDELKNACMLESVTQDGSIDEHVKMHDLIRDMGIVVTRASPLFMIQAGHSMRKSPAEDEWHPDLVRVSLMRNDLSCLGLGPRCPKLTTLLLQYNSISKGIDPSFFNHMPNLRVLDLSYTGIDKLPDSLSILVNLHALLLCSCWNLRCVPTLENLKQLRVLDLSYSSIEHMPVGMRMLLNLRRINLSYCKANDLPCISLPNYKLLENLLLIGLWQSFDLGKLFVKEVTNCINLSLLEANFCSLDDFNYYIESGHWGQLESFKFCIGYPQSSIHIARNGVALYGVHINEGRTNAPWFPGQILELELHDCSGITHLPGFITVACSELKGCKIQYCDDMQCIFTSGCGAFPSLEWLKIEDLRNLSSLCQGIREEGMLANLKVLNASSCNELRTLFSFEMVQNLKNLQEIVVEDCEKVEEIIGLRTEVNEVNYAEAVLPRLQKLRLNSLPMMRSICSTAMICDSLYTIEVLRCPYLRRLPFFEEIREPLIRSLRQIRGSRRWWEGLENNHPNAVRCLVSLFKEEPENSATYQYEIHSGGESGSSSFGPR